MPKREPGATEMIGARLPVALKRRLEDRAAANTRTLSQECQRALERSFSPEALLADAAALLAGVTQDDLRELLEALLASKKECTELPHKSPQQKSAAPKYQ